jgi:hypothetical protein
MESLLTESGMFVEEVVGAFSQARGRWEGCDWPTEFGKTGLTLDGLTASQALLVSRATAGSEAEDWRAAVAWLTHIEQEAREAREEASRAVDLTKSGKLQEALAHAQRACTIEARHHSRLVWQPLREAIDAALTAASGRR